MSLRVNGTTSQLIKTGQGQVRGIFVASGSTPTIKLWDNTAGSGSVLVNTFTPVIGSFTDLRDMDFTVGLFITVGGTVDYTIVYL